MNNNIDLTEIIRTGETNGTKKMNIKGQVKTMDVYRIPINMLYYNDKNDRIATWISKYEAEMGNIRETLKDNESYNNKIQEYIIRSDKQRFNNTMNKNDYYKSQLYAKIQVIKNMLILMLLF